MFFAIGRNEVKKGRNEVKKKEMFHKFMRACAYFYGISFFLLPRDRDVVIVYVFTPRGISLCFFSFLRFVLILAFPKTTIICLFYYSNNSSARCFDGASLAQHDRKHMVCVIKNNVSPIFCL